MLSDEEELIDWFKNLSLLNKQTLYTWSYIVLFDKQIIRMMEGNKMTDEEKKAIVELSHFSNMTAYWKQEEYTNSEIDNYIKLVLNLIENLIFKTETQKELLKYKTDKIEKQSKEIEELNKSDLSKEQSSMKYYNLYKELVDKIKAKIEEYEKALNILLQKDEWIEPSDTIIRNKFMHYIEFGQSLLEKE